MPTLATNYHLAQDDPRAAWAIFTVHEASRYLGVPDSTLRTWIAPEKGRPLVSSLEGRGYLPRLSFIGFAEAFVIAAAKHAGVPATRIRLGVEAVRKSIGVDFALATRRLYVDKAELLVAPEGGVDLDNPSDLEVARTKQIQMTKSVKNQLKDISYGDDGVAATLTLPIFKTTKVVVDRMRPSARPSSAATEFASGTWFRSGVPRKTCETSPTTST